MLCARAGDAPAATTNPNASNAAVRDMLPPRVLTDQTLASANGYVGEM